MDLRREDRSNTFSRTQINEFIMCLVKYSCSTTIFLRKTRNSSLFPPTKPSFLIQLDHSIVDNAGGFVQIGVYIYPFIKNPSDDQLYINLNDIRQNFVRPLSDFITYSKPTSPMSCLYEIVLEQARTHGHKNQFAKIFPSRKEESFTDNLPFLPLQRLLHLFLTKDSQFNLQFVQLFETSSFEDIQLNYQTTID